MNKERSTINYDSLGFVIPFLLPQGKLLLQQLCKENLGLDETIPEKIFRDNGQNGKDN